MSITKLTSGLYIVATPIGAARDITLRALDILQAADVIAAEDTRNTKRLLDIHSIRLGDRKLISYHDHSSPSRRDAILKVIDAGGSVALVSDAGTPMLADPGYHLVRHIKAAGHKVVAAPGASALLSALCVAGQPTNQFFFAGFIPNKEKARLDFLQAIAGIPSSLVFYESPKRLTKTLAAMVAVYGADRMGAVCRELTKKFEEVQTDTLGALQQQYDARDTPKGEVVIVLGPPVVHALSQDDVDAQILTALKDFKVKDAANEVAKATGLSRKDIYDRALRLKDS